jgi:hypothetical protein
VNQVLIDTNDILIEHLQLWSNDAPLLARFFNTLSYLEHIGSRKILACKFDFGEEQLRHAAEETRHALRFKEMSRTLAPDMYDDYTVYSLLGGNAAFFYFQRLDAMVRAFLQSKTLLQLPMVNYLLVTYIVETRAASLYPNLQDFIEERHLPISLKSIIAEENRHLDDIKASMKAASFIKKNELEILLYNEENLFRSFVHRVIGRVGMLIR